MSGVWATRGAPETIVELRSQVADLRRQLVDLAEERDLLVRQLVAIRTMVAEPGGFYVAELQRILDGAAR